MKMLKKLGILTAWFAVVCMVAVLVFAPVIYAKTTKKAQAVNSTAIVVLAEETATQATETDAVVGTVEHTVSTRLKEWFSQNFVAFMSSANLTAVGSALVAIILERKSNKKNTEETKSAMGETINAMKENTACNDQVLSVVNQLIDATNELKSNEELRDLAIDKLTTTVQAVMEILVTVYANNKNIPQATKDLVNFKYVTALKKGIASLIPEAFNKEEKTEE
jgi:hypothetical protein